jgi:hypothetical protein
MSLLKFFPAYVPSGETLISPGERDLIAITTYYTQQQPTAMSNFIPNLTNFASRRNKPSRKHASAPPTNNIYHPPRDPLNLIFDQFRGAQPQPVPD